MFTYPKTAHEGMRSQPDEKKLAAQKRGRSNRRKGARVENRLCHMHRDLGCDAQRVPLSGAAGGKFRDDICIVSPSGKVAFDAEVKSRKAGAGFRMIRQQLGDADALFLVEDRAEVLVVVPWSVYSRWMARL